MTGTAIGAQFTASAVLAVPALLDPMVTVPEGFCGTITSISGFVNVASLSPSGPGYQIRIAIDGVWGNVIATIVESIGFIYFESEIDPGISIDQLDRLELRVEPDYAPTGIVNWNDIVAYLSLELEPYAPTCDPTEPCTSGLTESDFMAILKSSADSAYIDPIVEAGDGNGLEVYTQSIAQFVRASEGIERTTQAMFVQQGSGQTNPESRGGKKACVPLLFSRGLMLDRTIVFGSTVRIGELETDAGETGGEEVLVERYYKLETPLVFNPGESGDRYARAFSERNGYGYNLPRIGSLRYLEQPGAGQHNIKASVYVLADGSPQIVCYPVPDVFGPHHVGQYIKMLSGSNTGRTGRVASYQSPDVALDPGGGAVTLEKVQTLRCRVFGSTQLQPGEYVYQPMTGAHGTVLRQSGVEPYFVLSLSVESAMSFSVGIGHTLVSLSGNFAILDPTVYPDTVILESFADWVPESVAAFWQMLTWEDLGISTINLVSPSGGRAGFLDALGHERAVERLTNESDDSYRSRIVAMADVVCPMAIRRAMIRILDPLGMIASFIEVGTEEFQGFFYDVPAVLAPDYSYAYDSTRDVDRWKTYLSLYEMRAFFLIEFEPSDLGDFGFSFDDHPWGAFDAAPYLAFFDGYGWISAKTRKQLWEDLNRRRAAGVAFDFVEHRHVLVPLP